MPSQRSTGAGAPLAGAGALILLASLWLPWYALRVPEVLREAFKGIGDEAARQTPQSGAPADALGQAFTGLFSGLAAAMPEEITAKGWVALDGPDVALAIISAAGLLLAVTLAGSGLRMHAADAAKALAALGAVALAIVAYHVVSPPDGDAPAFFGEDLMELRYGLAVAALGATLTLAGGLIGARQDVTHVAAFEPSAPQPLPDSGAGVGHAFGTPTSAFGELPEQPVALAASEASTAPPGWAPPAA